MQNTISQYEEVDWLTGCGTPHHCIIGGRLLFLKNGITMASQI
jgi:hypothetical protein